MNRGKKVKLAEIFSRKYPPPWKVLTVGIALNVILIPLAGSIIWDMYRSLAIMETERFHLQRLIGTIAHLNEVLTMSARMAAATGDPSWEERYREVEPKLDDAITEVAIAARKEYESGYAARTKLAYTRLIEMESVALALVAQGRQKEAAEILFSDEYNEEKAAYSGGLEHLTSSIKNRISGEMRSFRSHLWQVGVMAVLGLLVLLTAWVGVFVMLRKHLGERERTEAALEAEKERLAVTLRSLAEGVVTTDTDGRILTMNSEAESLTGWNHTKAMGRPLEEVVHLIGETTREVTENPVVKVLRTRSVVSSRNDTLLLSKDGTERIISQSAAPIFDSNNQIIGVVLVLRDITEHKRLQDEVIKAGKLESVGALAGGIAHDFNNTLTGILANVSFVKSGMDPWDSSAVRLDEAEKACIRAKGLTHQLLTFSQGGSPIKKVVCLEKLIVDWAEFALRGSNVRCEFRMDTNLRHVDIDEGQVSQVINNLVINACQAMPEGGALRISVHNRIIGPGDTLPVGEGDYVEVRVRDEGVGISPEHLKKVFEPYYTTKRDGTGLGLATCYRVLKSHDGHISAESELGSGTTFTVLIPATDKEFVPQNHVRPDMVSGHGRILLMDDEALIRELGKDILEALGYEVSVASDGREAIEIYRGALKNKQPFDVLIMDLTVPGGMGGKDAVMELRKFAPSARAIVSSGYSNDPIMSDYRSYGFCGMLPKPYSVQEMGRVLHQILD